MWTLYSFVDFCVSLQIAFMMWQVSGNKEGTYILHELCDITETVGDMSEDFTENAPLDESVDKPGPQYLISLLSEMDN